MILYKYAMYKGYDTDKAEDMDFDSYADAASVSKWADTAMKWAVGYDIIGGKKENGQTILFPGSNAIRAEAATMLQAFMTAYEMETE